MLETGTRRNSKRILVFGTVVVFLAIATAGSVRGATQSGSANGAKVPQTAKDHYDLAAHYQQEASELRAEIERHKQMLAEYSKGVAKNPKDLGENSYVKKMRLHCERYIKAAENLAAEATESAKFHILRGKELEGK